MQDAMRRSEEMTSYGFLFFPEGRHSWLKFFSAM